MAIGYGNTSSNWGYDATPSWNHTVGAGSNRLLIVGITTGATGTPATVGNVTFNGIPLTEHVTKLATNVRTYLFYLVAPPAGTFPIAFTMVGSSTHAEGALDLTGVDQSTPLGTGVSATGTSTAPSVAVSTSAGEVVVDSMVHYTTTSDTVGAGQTEIWAAGSAPMGGSGSREASADGSVTMSWTLGSSQEWATVATAIKPGGGGGGAGETAASEIWVIPARTQPLDIIEGRPWWEDPFYKPLYSGVLATALATRWPHLLSWKVDGTRFIWHDLGPVVGNEVGAVAVGPVMAGGGSESGLVLFGMSGDGYVHLTSLGPINLGVAQARFPMQGGFFEGTGVLYGSRMEFSELHHLLRLRVWGEDFEQEDMVRFAYRWDRSRWYSVGIMRGVPTELDISDSEGGLYLEWVVGITDHQATEPLAPRITRVDVQVEPFDRAVRAQADTQIPEVD